MKNHGQTQNLEQASVRQYCKAVRVPVIGTNFVSLAEQAVRENHSHIRYLDVPPVRRPSWSKMALGSQCRH